MDQTIEQMDMNTDLKKLNKMKHRKKTNYESINRQEVKGEKCNTCLIKIAVENRDNKEAIHEQMIVENFLDLMKDTHLQIQEAKVPSKVHKQKSRPRKSEHKP